MKKLLFVAGVAVAAPALLACCGIWSQASRQAVGEQCQDLSGKLLLVEDGPNKTRVQEVLDRYYIDANAGRFGIVDVAVFEVKVEECTSDGQLTDAETEVIENAYEEMVSK